MVVARSPSPNSSRSSNPNPNNLRKSGTFNISKSSSGSEIPQRNSSSKSTSSRPSPRSSFGQKENQTKPNCSKPARTKSPAINPSMGMKSFMAPTISASSKITAASPRAKILVERNQVVRDCMENDMVSAEEVKGEEIKKQPEIDFDSEEISGRSMSRKLDFSGSKGFCHLADTRSVDAGDSDADPCLPPYDPMKNYLSPRPRFLHYKPNPRIEQHHEFMEELLYEGEGRRLEDSFSDSEGSEDCSGYTEPSSRPKELEDDNLMKTQQAQVPDENHVFESKPRPETYKPIAKSFGKFKLISFLLVLSVLLFSVPLTDSPILSPFNMKEQSLTGPLTMPFRILQDIHLHDYLDVASSNLQGLATRMRQWSINSIKILISSASFSKEEQDMSHSFNTTPSSSMLHTAGLDFCSSSDLELAEKEIIVNKRNDLVEYMEMKFEPDKIDGVTLPGNDEVVAEKLEVGFYEDVNDGTELVKWKLEEDNNRKYDRLDSFTDPAVQFEAINKSDQLEKIEITITEEVGGEEGYTAGYDMPEKLEEQFLIELGEEKIHPINKEDINSTAYPVDETRMTDNKDFNAVPSVFSDTKFLILVVLGMLASVAVATKLISLFIKQKQNIPSSNGKPSNKKGGTKSCKHGSGDAYCNRGELAEMVCDSGPTEMSSSFNNNLSSFSKHRSKLGSHSVTPSHEIMERRESGVSSSISYGSFTSFEIRSRKGNKEEEVMTPVRRSSRIRNQVTSS